MAVNVVDPKKERTTTTPAGTMTALATPTSGSHQLSTWRVRMEPGSTSPEHRIDRDQVWMPVTGGFEVTVDGRTAEVTTGQAVTIPADSLRRVRTGTAPGEALVCMVPGGQASVPGKDGTIPLPWAE